MRSVRSPSKSLIATVFVRMMRTSDNLKNFDKRSKEDVIPVVYTPDAGYFIPAYISVFSMLCNAGGRDRIVVYMLVPGDFPSDCFSLLDELKERFSFFDYRVIDMRDRFRNVQINVPHIGTSSMYRLMIPDLPIDGDKCIYLDSDTVVEGDIRELYDEDVQNVYLAGVKDIGVTNHPENKPWHLQNLPSLDQYINSGVLLMNLRTMREDDVSRRLEEKAAIDCPFNDQDVINLVCYGNIRLLPFRFNAAAPYTYCKHKKYQHYYGIHDEESFTRARKDPVIVHYVGDRKPWSFRTKYGSHHWWKYAEMQDDRIRREIIRPFTDRTKGPINERIGEAAASLLAETGMSPLIRLIKKMTAITQGKGSI